MALFCAGNKIALAADWVSVGGNVYYGDTPLCALVLVNGQSRFSCDGSGRYDMDAPLDASGALTLQAFATGFAPVTELLSPAQAREYRVEMFRAVGGAEFQVDAFLSSSSAPGRAYVSGSVRAGGTPVCALVLANGQKMFSCNENLGLFGLDVPVDQNGNVTLMVFASGFKPYNQVFPATNLPTGKTLRGSVVASQGSIADGDVNDPAAAFLPNNSFSTAQEIPNPASVGGYVNRPGAGEPGRSLSSGDVADIYRISLVAGQRITLLLGDSTFPNDLDLFLGDTDGQLLASSEGVGSTETIIAPLTGVYLIEVYAYEGASSYVMTVGQEAFAGPVDTLSCLDDFVTGDAIVRYAARDDTPAVAPQAGPAGPAVKTTGKRKGRGRGRARLLKLKAASQAGSASQTIDTAAKAVPGPALMQGQTVTPEKAETIRMIKALRRRADITDADPNYIVRPWLEPSDQYYPLQWHYPMINLPQAWNVTTGSDDVVVAVIDTGAILTHPDLQGKLLQGYDFIRDPANAGDGDGIDSDPSDPGDNSNPSGSSSFHGTHVAGTIGAATNNVSGVSGVTWASSIMPLRALGLFGGTSYDIAQAVRYAAGLDNDSGTVPVQKADVINLSLGGSGFSQIQQDLFTEVRNEGVIVVASAGNENTGVPGYPASYEGVVSVGAVNIQKEKAAYSNYGARLDVVAPGGDSSDINGDGYPDLVLSTGGDNSSGVLEETFTFLGGTSMASPHVAGVAALMKALNPDLTPPMFDNLLATGQLTNDLGATGRDDFYGHGLIDAHKAVVAAGSAPSDPIMVANPASLNFGTVGTDLSLTLENGGGGVLFIDAPTDDASWLTVAPTDVDRDGNGTYVASVDRSGLEQDTYTATISIRSSANSISIPVIMQVGAAAESADAGFQYILLVDPISGETLDQVAASAIDGRYSYEFSDVPEGTYQIIAGSDSNNDFFICDTGESCGAYLTLDQPSDIEVSSSRALSDFPTGYLTGFSAAPSQVDGPARRSYRRLNSAPPGRRVR